MAGVKLSKVAGGSSYPRLGDLVAKSASFGIQFSSAYALASYNGGQALSTVLNITTGGVIDSLFVSNPNYMAAGLALPKVRVTVDGVIRFDGVITIAQNASMFLIGQGVKFGGSSGGSIVTSSYQFDTLKVEIDSTGEVEQSILFGNIQETA